MNQLEHNEQAAYFQWARGLEGRHPLLETLHAVINGAAVQRSKRADGSWSKSSRQAAKLKAEGMREGILDMNLPIPSADGRYIGLWIEFKIGDNRPEPEQIRKAMLLAMAGHRVEICYSWIRAAQVTEEHLGIPAQWRTEFWQAAPLPPGSEALVWPERTVAYA